MSESWNSLSSTQPGSPSPGHKGKAVDPRNYGELHLPDIPTNIDDQVAVLGRFEIPFLATEDPKMSQTPAPGDSEFSADSDKEFDLSCYLREC